MAQPPDTAVEQVARPAPKQDASGDEQGDPGEYRNNGHVADEECRNDQRQRNQKDAGDRYTLGWKDLTDKTHAPVY